jgi:O-antigen/teichoic acid export membrane protein
MLSSGLSFVAHPFYATLYPRFSQLVSLGDEESQKALYHRSTQLLVSIILPVAMVFAFFARQVLFLWTQNATIAQKAHWLLTFTMLGNLLNCLLFIPNVLQFSHGWTRLALLQNTVVLIALFPLQVILTTHFGPIGPPVLWFAVNVVWLITSIHLMHRRILKNEEKHWYIEDVGPQFLAVLTIVALSYFALSGFTSRWAQLISVCLVFCLSVITAAATSPFLRSFFLTSFRNHRNAERQ